MLECTRGKRGIRVAPLIGTFDVGHLPSCTVQMRDDGCRLILIGNVVFVELLAGNFHEVCLKRPTPATLWHQIRHDTPVFLGYEGFDFAFTLHHHAECYRLHPPG